MTRIADDFDAIRKAMRDKGLVRDEPAVVTDDGNSRLDRAWFYWGYTNPDKDLSTRNDPTSRIRAWRAHGTFLRAMM